jgi:pimeloyl-ACP methyl ester carboxylesterase
MAFLHPNPMDQSSWIYQMMHFSTWFRCIGVDMPGYGRSPKADSGLTMDDLAQAFWDCINDVEPGAPTILVGCSAGSRIIPYMYKQRPEMTAAVIMAGTGYSEQQSSFTNRINSYTEEGIAFRWLHNFVDFSPAFRATQMAHYFTEIFTERNVLGDADSIIHQFEALETADPQLVLRLACPTMIVSGTEDASHSRALDLKKRMPHAEFRAIPGAGHACFIEQPWLFDRYVREFLEHEGLLPNRESFG